MNLAKLTTAGLLSLVATFVAAQSQDTDLPRRKPLWGNSIEREVFNRQILVKGRPGQDLVPGDFPPARGLNTEKSVGTLIPVEHGLYRIGNFNSTMANVDFRDRGYVKEAQAFLAEYENKPVEAYCYLQIWGARVCDVIAKDTETGKDINLGATLLKNGWYGWQKEVGPTASAEGTRGATEAYWNYRGVWSNPWYFPDGKNRNAFATIKLNPNQSNPAAKPVK